jgi:tetratricopeptide (TPR) repeat protein
VQQLDRAFAGSSPRTIEGQALKAESLQNLNLPRQADDIYQKLLTELNRFYDDRGRWDVVLAAARNAANLGDLSTAISRYKLLGRYGMLTDEARLEYAGVLAKAGQTDEAARLLEQGSPTTADLRFLAEIYTSTSQFPKAVAVYRRLITHDSDDVWALEGIADNLLWSRDFAHAATAYRALLQHRPNDRSIRKALAESLLYDHRYQKAANEFAELLKSDPSNSTLWDSFLMAAAGSPSLSPSELAILERIYRSRAQGAGDNFESDLANAVAKHGKPEHAVPLLEGLLKRAPDDARLRLRLADTLHNLGRYKEADVQFRWLLNHPQTYARVKLK